MRRPAPLTRLGAVALFLVLPVLAAGCADEGSRPQPGSGRKHVLLITVDTLRPDYLGYFGYDLPSSPFIDSLMREGLVFPRAITPIPRTTQALASLMTGVYPRVTRVRNLFDSLAPEVTPLAEMAREAGYATIAVVSNHVLAPERGLNRGFDIYDFAPDIREAAATSNAAAGHLQGRSADEALFVWVHYIDPHVSYHPPERLARRFDPGYEGRYRLHFGAQAGGTGNAAYPEDLPKAEAVYRNPLPDEVNAHIRRLYAAEIRHTDENIALLVRWLRQNVADDWTIVFTADHGESLGEHDYFYDHGDYVYNPGLLVPLAITLPPGDELRATGRIDDWVSLVDLMPTLAELMNLDLPEQPGHGIEGRSLIPYFRRESPPRRPVFAECGMSYFPKMVRGRVSFDVKGRFRAILQGDTKLIWAPGADGAGEAQLYDLSEDPGEENDLYVPGHPEGSSLLAMLKDWTGVDDPEPSPLPSEEDLERLRSLGYLDDEP